MFPVTAVVAAGWLMLFILLLVVPPSSGSRRGTGLEGGTAPVPLPGGDEPPAVISLLTGKLDKLGFKATLIDLAARGWFQVTVQPVEPPAVARSLAAVAAEQQRAADGGLPDPAVLVIADQAAAILGGPVQGNHLSSPVGRVMTWQRTGKAEPVLRIDVRNAARPPGNPTAAQIGWPVPGVADGYLLGDKTVLYLSPLTVIISIRGTVPGGNAASLVPLLPLVEARLRELAARPGHESGYGG